MPESPEHASGKWLRAAEAIALIERSGLFPVPPSTFRDWSAAGLVDSRRTLGGHRRYREADILALINAMGEVAA